MKQLNTYFKHFFDLNLLLSNDRYSQFSVDSIFSLEMAYKMGLFNVSVFPALKARNLGEKNVNCQISFGVEVYNGI